MDTLFGEGPLKILVFVIVVLGLLALVFWLMRRFGGGRLGSGAARGRQPRLAVIDQANVDGRRRLVLIRRDNIEHLLIIGGPSDVVVEQNIVRAATAPREGAAVRPPAADTLPRAVPLGEDSMWPPEPEPAQKAEATPRVEPPLRAEPRPQRPPMASEEPMLWPGEPAVGAASAGRAPAGGASFRTRAQAARRGGRIGGGIVSRARRSRIRRATPHAAVAAAAAEPGRACAEIGGGPEPLGNGAATRGRATSPRQGRRHPWRRRSAEVRACIRAIHGLRRHPGWTRRCAARSRAMTPARLRARPSR